MATNSFKVIDFIGKKILARLVNSLALVHTANREWEGSWSSNEYKIGDTVRIRKPVYFTVSQGSALQPQGIIEREDTLSITYQSHVDLAISSIQDQRFLSNPEQNIYAAVAQAIANDMDANLSLQAKTRVWRTVGTPGSGVTSFATPNLAITKQRMFGVSESEYMAFNSSDAGSLRSALQNSFNVPFNEDISQRAVIGSFGQHDLLEDQNLNVPHTTGTFAGTVLVDGASQEGTSIDLKGFTASQTGVLKAGDVISFASVYGVNPVNLQQVGYGSTNLSQFVVQADVNSDASGLATVSILPAIVVSGPYQNVTSSPADNAPVTCFGVVTPGTATSWSTNYAYSKDAFTFACVPPPIVASPYCKVFTDEDTNISIRCAIVYDPSTDQNVFRFDTYYGIQVFGDYVTRIAG